MVLADTSVWIEHFRYGEPTLADHLSDGRVLMHPFVCGELACGTLKNRGVVLSDLHALPSATQATAAEVLKLIEDRKLWGRGLGWIDVHLLSSALLSHCAFWTLDKRLAEAARDLRLKSPAHFPILRSAQELTLRKPPNQYQQPNHPFTRDAPPLAPGQT